jgi:hypothetical protein
MPQIFRPRADSIARLLLVAIVVAPLGAIGIAYLVHTTAWETRVDVVVNQPVPFSHEHHVGEEGIDCRYCHTSVETAAFAGLPPTHICMTCHSQLWTNAAMLAPVRESLATGTPIHWQRVNWLPDFVFFDHSVHVNNGIGCTTCHGDVAKMPLTRQARPLTMRWCISCHQDPAPHLRPPDKIFATNWKPPANQAEEGKKLMRFYQIHKKHLTDCSVCHR